MASMTTLLLCICVFAFSRASVIPLLTVDNIGLGNNPYGKTAPPGMHMADGQHGGTTAFVITQGLSQSDTTRTANALAYCCNAYSGGRQSQCVEQFVEQAYPRYQNQVARDYSPIVIKLPQALPYTIVATMDNPSCDYAIWGT